MRILLCNERFLFRFGVDRCLLMLGGIWKAEGHEVIMMGNRLDPAAVDKCSSRFISVPEAPEYLRGNDFTLDFLRTHWDEWFTPDTAPDLALVAGWPFYRCIGFLREKCGCAIFQDYGAVPTEGMAEGPKTVQRELRRLRRENLPLASRVVAISRFLQETQSIPDAAGHTPSSVVYCGIDHIAGRLWSGNELNLAENDVLRQIRELKDSGVRILFQPGRWESGNYKNSPATAAISERLSREGIPHRILVLSDREGLTGLDSGTANNYFCLGFVDDETMKAAMELSDVGVSPTLWEGFDLPLGELQYLNRPMFVLDVGAHPEVICDPAFLCKDLEDMADQVVAFLREGPAMGQKQFLARCEAFRESFTWQRSADGLMAEFRQALKDETTLLADVTNACHDTANSGVMRVTRKLSRHLQRGLTTVFVLWDASAHAFVLPYEDEIHTLCSYQGPEADAIRYRSAEGRPRSLLSDVLPDLPGTRRVFLWTETVKAEILQEATPWLRERGIATAAVFHDAIPVLRPELVSQEVRRNHGAYMTALAELDLALPTARHNQQDLEDFWRDTGLKPRAAAVTANLAAEIDGVPRVTQPLQPAANRTRQALFVSTLEPRKNHIRLLRAVEIMYQTHPEAEGALSLHLIGNRYAGNDEIPDFVEGFCASHPNVRWLGVVDDDTLRSEYASCDFTVYPSEIEGFGMPIVESLWAGKPCLCSSAGSIGELAAQGGCLTVDVLDEKAMADALFQLITDQSLLCRLSTEAVSRPITTWGEYADSVTRAFCSLHIAPRAISGADLPQDVKALLRGHFAGWTGRRVIIASNYYPPAFVGGAEIIAHRQLRALHDGGHARGLAFTLDVSQEHPEGTVTASLFEGVPVIRVCMPPTVFDLNAVHFFSRIINDVFRSLCGLVRPTVLHCHNLFGLSMGIVDIAKAFGAKVFFTLHDNWGFCYKNTMLDRNGQLCGDVFDCDACKDAMTAGGIRIPMGLRRSYLRRVFEKADALISPSRYLADMYLRVGFDYHRLHVLWNGIDMEQYADVSPAAGAEIRITFAGYFGAHKGVDVLIRAVARLKRKDVRLNLVGSGAEEAAYRALAESLGVGSCLRFWGKIDNRDMKKVYQETDIYCLPSVWPENQPVSITEAMACGIPVVASDLGGSRELVSDGETGWIFPAGDDAALADRLSALLDDPALRRQMGRAGRARVSKADFSAQVARLAGLYDTVSLAPCAISKPLILVKGSVLPPHVHRATSKDLLLWEWILDEKDLEQAVGCVFLPGETAAPRELAFLRENGLPALVRSKDQAPGCKVLCYADDADLIRLIARL